MDDLLDLDWAKGSSGHANGTGPAATAAKSTTQTASSVRSNGSANSSYNFDALTRSMPIAAGSNISRPHSASQQGGMAPKSTTAAAAATSSGDAFSSLLGFGGGGSGGGATMSMAERLRQGQPSPSYGNQIGVVKSAAPQQSSSAWDGLDDFLGPAASQKPAPAPARPSPSLAPARGAPPPQTKRQSTNDDDLWNFASPAASSQVHARTSSAAERATVAPSASSKAAVKPASKDPFDFSEFEDPGDSQSSALGGGGGEESGQQRPARVDSGSKAGKQRQQPSLMEDSFGDGGDDDDLLGALGRRPARPLASAYEESAWEPEPPRPSKQAKAAARSTARSASPPPHIIGQVVEMGFSPQQAREALARTPGGQDVQAALEMLLQSADHASANGRGPIQDRQPTRPSGRSGRRGEDEESDRRMAMRLQKEEEAERSGRRGSPRHDEDDPSRTGTPDWQKQADQIYAQASELSANMFSKANALWTTAKTQAQRALDEHSGANSATSSGRASPTAGAATGSERARSRRWAVPARDGGAARKEWQGKPKWMIDAEAAEAEGNEQPTSASTGAQTGAGGGFKDDDADVREAPPFFAPKATARRKVEQASPPPNANLWDSEEPQSAPSQRQPSPAAMSSASVRPTAPSAAPPAARSRPAASAARPAAALRQRPLVQDDASAVATASQHKLRGNALFKRGAYGEAEDAYSSAISALDANPHSIRRVTLFNNRANARLKNGDAKGALDDTMAVLRIIVVDEQAKSSPFLLFRPSQEAPLPSSYTGEVNLRDGYAKALLRRAQAEEMLERWDPALSVWSLLDKYEREEGSGTGGVTNMRAAQEGKGRCGKMLKGGDVTNASGAAGAAATANPRVRAAAARAIAKAEANAKERIRRENTAAAAEETAKDGLRHTVDARITAWRTGKESNVRALLASLQDVVWPSLGWKRVGMHELVMDNQVKKVYMRAIGKLHPDKLTPNSNTTLEERMIGGAVFSVLNDAWSAAQGG